MSEQTARTLNDKQDEQDFWFAKVDADVVRDTKLSPTARLIFTVLCTFADKDKRGCWPSNEAVAEAAGVSKSTVIRACKELEARGVIARSDRFNDNGQTSSYTRIVGHNAECYDGVAPMTPPSSTDDTPPVAPMTHGTRINEQELKDSLTREAQLPEKVCEEVCTPEDAPDIMQITARYFLQQTGRQRLTWDEISALRELAVNQVPTRVQKEIDTAVKRFLKRGQSLSTLTFGYIAGALKHQPTLGRKRKKAKPSTPEPETYTQNELAEMDAEIAAMQAEIDKEAQI